MTCTLMSTLLMEYNNRVIKAHLHHMSHCICYGIQFQVFFNRYNVLHTCTKKLFGRIWYYYIVLYTLVLEINDEGMVGKSVNYIPDNTIKGHR